MIALLQRVSRAEVVAGGETAASIGHGLLVLVGVESDDSEADTRRLVDRVLGYRVFDDETGRMNLDVRTVSGGVLFVPQFTLAADTKKGRRPSFTSAAESQRAVELFEGLVQLASLQYEHVSSGVFRAHMEVSLTNDGPVTFWLGTRR